MSHRLFEGVGNSCINFYLANLDVINSARLKLYKDNKIYEPTFLWDGRSRLEGKLVLSETHLTFCFKDFKASKLEFGFTLDNVVELHAYKLYEIESIGLKVGLEDKRWYIFILHNPNQLKQELEKRITGV